MRSAPRIDSHVHLVGTGSSGTGSSYPRPSRYTWLVPLLARCFGLPAGSVWGNFDERYAGRLLRYLDESSLDALVLLALDHPYDDRGQRIEGTSAFYVPNDAVLDLASRHPGVLPGVSIHPGRPDALDELARCVEAGAVLLKLIPNCHNVDLASPRHRPFWRALADAGLPLLAHTGRESALEELEPRYGHPAGLVGPLREGVTVIAAHCGGVYQSDFLSLLPKHPRLYGDTAAFNAPFSRRRLPALLHPEVVTRLVHGSDVPAPVTGLPAWWRREISWRTWRRCHRQRNPLERDVLLKRALGFPPEVLSRVADLLRLPPRTRPLPTALASGRQPTRRVGNQ